jgi:hypothetical protein
MMLILLVDKENRMNEVCTLHDQAMFVMNEAFSFKEANRFEEARKKFLEACDLELQAATLVEKPPENEPSRSMLYLGAASLAVMIDNFSLATKLVSECLSGYPPEEIKTEVVMLGDAIQEYQASTSCPGQQTSNGTQSQGAKDENN